MSNYKEQRKKEYPSIEEQLDMLYHFFSRTNTLQQATVTIDDEDIPVPNYWYEKIKSIKDKYPKPEGTENLPPEL